MLRSCSGVEGREYGRADSSRWPRDTVYSQELSVTSLTSGGRSVGIVRSRTQATESLGCIEKRQCQDDLAANMPSPSSVIGVSVLCRSVRTAWGADHRPRGGPCRRSGETQLRLRPGEGPAVYHQMVSRRRGVLPLRAQGVATNQSVPTARHPRRCKYQPESYSSSSMLQKCGPGSWVPGPCPSCGILDIRKHNVPETGSVTVLSWGEGNTYSVGSLRKSLQQGLA
jgi:hypothetical protein